MDVRVRYAPSPTGLQHIGGVRSALFDYFFARSQGGSFILRIEDTDQTRFDEAAMQDLYDTFSWLGIHWDEGPDVGGSFGPYVQSERFEIYQRYARELLESGHAYECFCSAERLEEVRKTHAAGYDRHCRNLSQEEIAGNRQKGIKPVVRFKVPLDGTTVMDDQLLGRIERKNEDITPDPVILKSDGFPTYHLAHVVDDHLMQISHVLRGQEWVPSGALHVLLFEAFGWDPPHFCHLPIVVGSDGRKLSKRHGSTSILEFRRQGYLPEAVINYVTLLGWAYDDARELFSKEELEQLFTLDKLHKAPAVFDYKKLDWFNGQYIRLKSDEELAALVAPLLADAGLVGSPPSGEEAARVLAAMPLIHERLHVLNDVSEQLRFLFRDVTEYRLEELVPKRLDAATAAAGLRSAKALLEAFEERTDEANETLLRERAEELGVKLGDFLMPVRVAVTGTRVSPPLLGSLRLLGSTTVSRRIDNAIRFLEAQG